MDAVNCTVHSRLTALLILVEDILFDGSVLVTPKYIYVRLYMSMNMHAFSVPADCFYSLTLLKRLILGDLGHSSGNDL